MMALALTRTLSCTTAAITSFIAGAPMQALAKPPEPEPLVSPERRDATLAQLVDCLAALNGLADEGCPGGSPVSFAVRSDRPTGTAPAFYRDLGALLNRPEARRLKVGLVGHADCSEALPNDPHAARLAYRRAEAVRSLLERYGRVKERRIVIEGRGSSDPLGHAARSSASCKAPDRANRRVSFSITTPIGVGYGGLAVEQHATTLAGADPAPRDNIDPSAADTRKVEARARAKVYESAGKPLAAMTDEDKIKLAQAADAAARKAARELRATTRNRFSPPVTNRTGAASEAVVRYFPQGLTPARYYTVDLGRAQPGLGPTTTGANAVACSGVRSGWVRLDNISLLDQRAGQLYVRLRTVLVSGSKSRGRDLRSALLLDISDSDPAVQARSAPSSPGYWALRERIAPFLQALLTKSTPPPEIPQIAGMHDLLSGPCGVPAAAVDRQQSRPADADELIVKVVAAAPATAEDVLARAYDYNARGFVRLVPGMQLCVTPAEPMVADLDEIEFKLGMGSDRCAMLRRFEFDTGRQGLTIGGESSLRYRDPSSPTQIPTARWNTDDGGQGDVVSDSEQLIVSRLTDLIDPARSAPAYLIWAQEDQPAWVGGDWAARVEDSTFILGLRAPVVHPAYDLGLMMVNEFYADAGQACRSSGEELALPSSANFRVPGRYWLSGDPTANLKTAGEGWWGRCTTSERAAEIAVRLPVQMDGRITEVPLGTTWGELASLAPAASEQLPRAALGSRAAALVFGTRDQVTLSSRAAARLPILLGDNAPW